MRSSRVYINPYTLSMICITMCTTRCVFYVFNWNLVLFISKSNLSKFPVWRPTIKYDALTGSTFGINNRFRSGMQTKQEPACWQVKLVSITQCSFQLCLCLFYNQTRRVIYRSDEALYGECSYIEEKSHVYNYYTRQDCPMGNSQQMLQYYKYIFDDLVNNVWSV